MRFASVLAAAAIAVSCGSGVVQAQGLKKAIPAEFPPASYTGRQYVDSKGCVFIRAGVDGAVTWIPRVTRGRDHICGQQPTLSASAAAAAKTQPVATASPPPKVITVPAARPAAAPAPAPKVVSTPAYRSAPAPAPAPAVPAAPKTIVVATPAPAPAPAPKRVQVADCRGGSVISGQYLTHRGYAVRCGPQTAPHVTERATAGPNATVWRYGAVPAGSAASYRTGTYATTAPRVAPKHVYAMQKTSTQGVYVPEGYASIWEDDRLNPHRAHQTFAGKAQMDLIWTKTVPRRLIVRETGQVVTRDYPGLQYPYTSYAQQGTAAATVSTKGQAPATVSTKGQAPAPAATQMARAEPRPEASARQASHRYVQLGAFTDVANARSVAQKLANSGLPARMGKITQKGQKLTLVLAGPFSTQSQLDSGLRRVRGLGYTQAVLRK